MWRISHSGELALIAASLVLLTCGYSTALAEQDQHCLLKEDSFPYMDIRVSKSETSDFLSEGVRYVDKSSNVCAALDIKPEVYWRQSFFSRTREQECSMATSTLHEVFEPVQEGIPKINWSNSAHSSAVRNYVDACVRSIGSITDPNGGYGDCLNPERANILTYMIEQEQVDNIFHSVGDLRPVNEASDCTATIVKLSSGRRVLVTAAHCTIRDMHRASGGETWIVDKVYSNLLFRSYSGITIDIDASGVAGGLVGKELDLSAGDIAFFPLDVNNEIPGEIGIEMSESSPEAYAPIYIVGRNPYVRLLNKRDGISEKSDPKEFISITFDRSCVLIGRKDGHVFHNCQTQGGMSGAPILTFEGGLVSVVGVHTGGKRYSNSLCASDSVGADNFGIALIDE